MDKVLQLIKSEEKRQQETLMMIPSENYTYPEVRKAVGSALMHKYSEGYPHARYYQGNEFVDQIEDIAIDRAKKLFGVAHANVQAYSGSPANSAVYFALLLPGDTVMGMALSAGGHLTHGHPKITFSGKYFNSIQYGLDEEGYIDFIALRKLAKEHKPKIIVAGLTAYPRALDWKQFADIAEEVGAYLLADISHIAGLVAGGAQASPKDFAHIVTTTTHKTLRGPRGAMIMVTQKGIDKDPDLPKKIDRGVFPGLQGGPHNNQTAGIALMLDEASKAEFKAYARDVVENAKHLAKELVKNGFDLVTGGTDNHLLLLDLRSKNILGKPFAIALEKAGIVVNYNAVPNDPNPPMNPSGIRLGTPALTVRGMEKKEMETIAKLIGEVSINMENETALQNINKEVKALCEKFPVKF